MRPILTVVLASLLATPGAAQSSRGAKAPLPSQWRALIACRAQADEAARLRCFDRETAALQAAEARGEVVVVDRGEVRRARRSLFGLNLPDFRLLGGGDDQDAADRVETTVRSAAKDANGRWNIIVADGARWSQADSRELSASPKPGQTIVIRRAALGSFLANVNGQTAIRVRRVN